MMKKLKYCSLIPLSLYLGSNALAAIEPSQAFSTSVTVAEKKAREELGLHEGYRLAEVSMGIGKYDVNRFGDYSVNLRFFSEANTIDEYVCDVRFQIVKVPFAKQPGGTLILETAFNDFQIIVRANHTSVDCHQ